LSCSRFLPGEIQLRNAILLIPVVVTGAILYPLWHNVRWSVHVWPLAIAVGWAQALAIWDYARGKVMSWDPSRSPKDATRRFRKAVFVWNGTLAVLWVVLAAWRVEQSHSSRFAVVALFGPGEPGHHCPGHLPRKGRSMNCRLVTTGALGALVLMLAGCVSPRYSVTAPPAPKPVHATIAATP